jgi:hypothetical protein
LKGRHRALKYGSDAKGRNPFGDRQFLSFLVQYGVLSMQKQWILPRLFAFVCASVFLSACGSKKEGAQVLVVSNNQRLSDASCEVPIDEGDPFDPLKVNLSSIVISEFSKTYNGEHLRALGPISMKASAEFVQKAGVRLFATPGSKENCRPLAKLIPAATNSMMAHWFEVSRLFDGVQADGSVRSGLMGLYDSDFQGSPHIFVREDISRLDLVHEYFHHLFKSRTEARENSVLKERFDDALIALKLKQSSGGSTGEVIDRARTAQEALWRLLVASHLEESVIGYELLSRVVTGEIAHVAKSGLGSHWDYTLVRLKIGIDEWNGFHSVLPADVLAGVTEEYLRHQDELVTFAMKIKELESPVLALAGEKKKTKNAAAALIESQGSAAFSCSY